MGIKKTIVITFFFFISLSTFSQNNIQELRQKLERSKEDSNKVNILISLSKEYLSSDLELSKIYASEAKRIALFINYPSGVAYGYKGLGLAFLIQGKYIETIDNFEKSLAVFDSIGDKKGQANILSNEGTVYFNQSDDAKALELFLKALNVAEQTTDSSRIATILLNIGAIYAHKKATYEKAEDFYLRAQSIAKSLEDRNIIATINSNLGELKLIKEDYEAAIGFLKSSLKEYNGSENTPYALNLLGKTYQKKGDYSTAIMYHQQASDFSKKIDAPLDIAQSMLGLGDAYASKGDYQAAIKYYQAAEEIAIKISSANDEMKIAYLGLAIAYAKQNDFGNAYKYQVLYSVIKDSLYNIDTDKKLSGLQFNFDIQKKQAQLDLLTKDKSLADLNLKRQKIAKNALIGGITLVFFIALVIYRNYRSKLRTNIILDKQKAEIEGLLLNILPEEVAQELKNNGKAQPRYYEKVSVLFTDFKGFSKLADELSPQDVVTVLNEYFIAFDEIIGKHNLEKIKTIGDSYMCAGGIPVPDDSHVLNMIRASMEIRDFITTRNAKRLEAGLPPWDIRIGINTGPVVAGVVGRKKYAYDIWGGTVNIASRMESNGESGKINISSATYELIKDHFDCTYRGKIYAKNIGEIDMFFVDRKT